MDTTEYKPQLQAPTPLPRQRPGRKKPIGWIIPIFAVLALGFLLMVAGAAGYLLYTGSMYSKAAACIENQDYKTAVEDLGRVAVFFKDSRQLMKYAQAGEARQGGNFYGARLLYVGLGSFRDSATMVSETDYEEAQHLFAQHEFDRARELFSALGEYKDAKGMVPEADYQKGVYLLDQGDFQQAKDLFIALGSYRDAKQMILESDYRKAFSLLEGGKFDDAETVFEALAKAKYKDSVTMLGKAYCENAQALYDSGKYVDAFVSIKKASAYRDSAAVLDAIREALYAEGVKLYRSKNYSDANIDFSLIDPYKDSSSYITLFAAHNKTDFWFLYSDPVSMRSLYKKLKALGNFEDADAVRASNGFIFLRLEGNWRGEGYYFDLTCNTAKNTWDLSCNIPSPVGKYYDISDGAVMVGNDMKLLKGALKLTFLSENKMQVTCIKNGKTYTMTR